jgi:hypothetical protein
MNRAFALILFSALTTASPFAAAAKPSSTDAPGTPVLVELFTSEGCSSCPPADKFLQDLDRLQPVPGASLIVLSEHVDYWNHDGWKDPFSSHLLTERQSSYAAHFGLESPYTPQMIVDGTAEFVGNSPKRARPILEKAANTGKIEIRVSSITVDGSTLRAHVEAGQLPARGPSHAEVWVAIALNRAEAQVSAGENEGHKLTHVSVVRSLVSIGKVDNKKNFSADVRLSLNPSDDPANLRLVAFVQASGPGQVLGAALTPVLR